MLFLPFSFLNGQSTDLHGRRKPVEDEHISYRWFHRNVESTCDGSPSKQAWAMLSSDTVGGMVVWTGSCHVLACQKTLKEKKKRRPPAPALPLSFSPSFFFSFHHPPSSNQQHTYTQPPSLTYTHTMASDKEHNPASCNKNINQRSFNYFFINSYDHSSSLCLKNKDTNPRGTDENVPLTVTKPKLTLPPFLPSSTL